MARPIAALLALSSLVFSLAGPARTASAEEEEAPTPSPPRDVGVVVQSSTAALASAPADFQRIDRGWISLEFPSSVRERMGSLLGDADKVRVRLSGDFGQEVLNHAIVRVARTPAQMVELAPGDAPPPPYAAGVAYPAAHLVVLALQAPDTWDAPDLPELLRHELSHLALFDAVEGHHTPRWFDEGMAIHESGELPWARRLALADASLSRRLLPFADLDSGFPVDRYQVNIAYAESADFVSFLLRDVDRARFGSLVERVRSGAPFGRALEDAYGTNLRKLDYEWREEVSRRFGLVPALTGGGLLWVTIAGLTVMAWAKRRAGAKEKLARWAREEAEMAAVVAAAHKREEPAQTAAEGEEMPSGPAAGVPVVEHEGRWYTVH